MTSSSGVVFDIQKFSLDDGPGIRTTVFLKGCALNCPWCHNPEGLELAPQLLLREQRCVAGCSCCTRVCPERPAGREEVVARYDSDACAGCDACVDACPSGALEKVGEYRSVEEVVAEVLRDADFFESSAGGVTFSGGEPLYQPKFLRALVRAFRSRGVHVAIETSLVGPAALVSELCADVDLFIVDVKACDEDVLRRGRERGRGRERDEGEGEREGGGERLWRMLRENLRVIAGSESALWVRVPLVAGYTDGEESIRRAVELLGEFRHAIERIELLPYHPLGESKRRMLGLGEPALARPTGDVCARIVESFAALSVPVSLAG